MSSMSSTRTSFIRNPRRLLPTVVAGVAGILILLDSAGSGGGVVAPVAFTLVNWTAVLIALALLVGLLSVSGSHLKRVLKRKEEWGYSVVLLLAMLTVIVVGIFGVPGVLLLPPNLAEEPIRRLFQAVYVPLTGSMLALLAFFSLSTLIRALQRRSAEIIVIVGVALVVLIVQIPFVAELPMVTGILQWINQYIAMAGARGLLIGVAIGTLVASMRVLLGFDQPYLDH